MLNVLAQNLALTPYESIPISIKLIGHNNLLWKEQMLNYLIAYGLKGLINGTIGVPHQFLDLGCTVPSLLIGID